MHDERVTPSQTAAFNDGEADRWFARNRDSLVEASINDDACMRLASLYHLRPTKVVEIGAANGYRMAAFGDKFGCEATAVEPSADAIADGQLRYPSVRFVHAAGHDIPLSEVFDLAIVNFVFHWVARELLLRTAAEVDRLLAPHGHLIIGDFLPATMSKRRYHHLPDAEIYTYKQDYAAIFASTGCYEVLALLTGAHEGGVPSETADQADRTGVWLLRKRLDLHPESA
jgi:SAM-dependent methyltransferase